MKIKPIIIAMPVMFTLLTGCSTWDSQNPNLHSLWPFKHDRMMGMGMASNGDIIQELMTMNKTEIALTKYAKIHASCPKVRRLASSLHADHIQNLHKVEHLSRHTGIAPVINPVATHIEREDQRELDRLRTLRHSDFDKAFIADTINDHQHALRIIDSGIMQSTNSELTAYLKTTRKHVAMHLHRAESLQKELNLY